MVVTSEDSLLKDEDAAARAIDDFAGLLHNRIEGFVETLCVDHVLEQLKQVLHPLKVKYSFQMELGIAFQFA